MCGRFTLTPADVSALARERGLPVIVETWLGGPCEELEPLLGDLPKLAASTPSQRPSPG